MTTQTSYQKKLQDPRWQKKRLEILKRDGFTCRYCGYDMDTLHIHHLSYSKMPWESDESQLITACKHCHSIIEDFKNERAGSFKIIRVTQTYGFVMEFYLDVPEPDRAGVYIFEVRDGILTYLTAFKKVAIIRHFNNMV